MRSRAQHVVFAIGSMVSFVGLAASVILWERHTPNPYVGDDGGTVLGYSAQPFFIATGVASLVAAVTTTIGAVVTRERP